MNRLGLLAFAGFTTAAVAGIPDARPPAATGRETRRDLSPPLRVMPPVAPRPGGEIREKGDGEHDRRVLPGANRTAVDAALQSSPGPGLMPSPGVNFNGMGNIDGILPPDPVIAVGPNHVVEAINNSLQIYSKAGASLYGPVNLSTLWQGFGGPCQTDNDGDPEVLYDRNADRWVVAQFTASSPFGECVAVSQTADPTGAWYRYFFQFSTTIFYDYPKLGVWSDGYYLTANRFSTAAFVGLSAIALDRVKLLAGQPATYQEFQNAGDGNILPADLDGATLPPTGAAEYFLSMFSTSQLNLYRLHVDWITPASSTFTGPIAITVAAFIQLCPSTRGCVDQPVTTVNLDGFGDRLMNRLAYRNFGDHEALVASHAVDVNPTAVNQAAVRWYELRATPPGGTPAIFQQGSYAPDATNRWMGSVAMDRDGNLALGYSVSGGAVFPGLRYAGRLATDPAGQLPQSEATLIAGGGAQTHSASRWGDYAALVLDPADDCTFWFASEYMPTTSSAAWQTRIGAFKFPTCGTLNPKPVPDGQFVPGAPMTAAKSGGNLNLAWSVSGCASNGYNLYWGALGNYAALGGAACALAPTGSAVNLAVPDGSFFVLTGAANGKIAPFGHTGAGAEESFTGWSALCPEATQQSGATCN